MNKELRKAESALPNEQTIAGLLLDFEKERTGLTDAEFGEIPKIEEAFKLTKIPGGVAGIQKLVNGDASVAAAMGMVNTMRDNIQSSSEFNLAETAKKYRESFKSNDYFSFNNMHKGMKALLIAAAIGLAFKNPSLAGGLALGAGVLTYATGSSDPFEAGEKIVKYLGNKGSDVLAQAGIGDKSEWLDEEKEYGVDINSTDALALKALGTVKTQTIYDSYKGSESSMNHIGTGKLNKNPFDPPLTDLVGNSSALRSMGLNEEKMQTAFRKSLEMRAAKEGLKT